MHARQNSVIKAKTEDGFAFWPNVEHVFNFLLRYLLIALQWYLPLVFVLPS